MSVMFDLTTVGPELFDSVIFMDNSPALAAFKEEIGKIVADINKSDRFANSGTIDVDKLLNSSADTLLHMQRAFLIWSFNEDYDQKPINENSFIRFLKLFFKSQENVLIELNGGSKLIDVSNIEGFRKKFLNKISSDAELFNSIKDFFTGYVYGYFFNYIEEQSIMKDYAEMLVCLGIISNVIQTSATQKQKTMLSMATLLNNNRFKYISGVIPFDIIMNIICERFDFTGISDEECAVLKDALKDFILANYYHEDDGGVSVSDTVVTDVMTRLNAHYINADAFANEIFRNSYSGKRYFLDGDKDDVGAYNAERFAEIIAAKCGNDFNKYYSSGRDGVADTALGSDFKGYKYPLVYKDGAVFMFADIFKEMLFPAIDSAIYVPVDSADLPIKDYPFIDATLRTNIIRVLGGLDREGFTVRADKKGIIDEIKLLLKSKTISDDERHMLMLEKTLYLISGNMETNPYQRLVNDCIFGTSLYKEYIRYRMDCLFARGMKDINAKKNLLDELNSIN